MKELKLDKSLLLWRKAVQVIPNGTQSFSKGPTQFSFGTCPIYLTEGKGAKVIDVDGNEYIDYGMGLHSVILGYSHPEVTKRVKEAVEKGINLTLMHPLEEEVAAILIDRIPCAEMVRFTKTGSEATSAAVRIARAITGKDHVATCGYHGWSDWFLGVTERSAGIPQVIQEMVHKFSYNDIESLELLFDENRDKIGAVIMEPCGVIPPSEGFLEKCKELARQNGAVFIFDETITGIRWDNGGAQALFEVVPDLAIFGKSVANGMPLAVLVGKREYMEVLNRPDVFFSTTYGGEIASLAACKATMGVLDEENVIPFIWEKGKELQDGFNDLVDKNELREYLEMVGFPCRPVVMFKAKEYLEPLVLKSYLQQECAVRGLLFAGYFAMSLAHTKSIVESSLQIFGEVLKDIKGDIEENTLKKRLRGEVVSPVFRKL